MARDEDLEKALESGDFINVGSLEDKEGVSSSDLKKISFDLKLPEYNDLIGIEFSKTIPPEAYLVSTQLLELITDLPKIDKQKRYFLQSLLNELLLGNALKYKNDLLDYVIKNNIENILENNLKKINHNLSLTSLAIALAYILESVVDLNVSFAEKKELLEFVQNEQIRSKMQRKWKHSLKGLSLREYRIHYVIQTLTWNIANIFQSYLNSEDDSEGLRKENHWENALYSIQAMDYEPIKKIAAEFSKILSPIQESQNPDTRKDQSEINNLFVDCIEYALRSIIQSL